MIGKSITLLLLAVTIASCTAPNNTKKLINSINNELQKNYKINNGYLVATYDLAKIHKNNNNIYSKDFVKIINDGSYNKIFLKKLKLRLKDLKVLESQATRKIQQIKNLALKLNDKYKFLSKSQLTMFYDKQKKDHIFNSLNRGTNKINSMLELLKLDKILSTIPVLLPEYQPVITSHYGNRKDPHHKNINKLHCGIDLVGPQSSPIYSAADGIVAVIKREKGYGNNIEIFHNVKFKTKYAHLKKIYVKEGDVVLRGQKIGLQGNTGKSTAEHLHFEIWLNGKHVNPFDFISHACCN